MCFAVVKNYQKRQNKHIKKRLSPKEQQEKNKTMMKLFSKVLSESDLGDSLNMIAEENNRKGILHRMVEEDLKR